MYTIIHIYYADCTLIFSRIECFVNEMKAWFSFRIVSVHSAAHHERNWPEGHSERFASRNGPPTGSWWHDTVADHHQHLRTAQKEKTQRHQHVRGRRPTPEREEEGSRAHRRWGVCFIIFYSETLFCIWIYWTLKCSSCVHRCPFLAGFLTFALEMEYTLDSLWIFLISLILKPCLT